jgi:hypothetical protein
MHHLLDYVGRKKEIPRISFIFLCWPNLPPKFDLQCVCHKYQIVKMPGKTRNLLTVKLKRAFIKCFEEFKKHDELRPKRLSTVLFHNPTLFDTFKHTKNKSSGRCRLYFRGRMQCWWIFDFDTNYRCKTLSLSFPTKTYSCLGENSSIFFI